MNNGRHPLIDWVFLLIVSIMVLILGYATASVGPQLFQQEDYSGYD